MYSIYALANHKPSSDTPHAHVPKMAYEKPPTLISHVNSASLGTNFTKPIINKTYDASLKEQENVRNKELTENNNKPIKTQIINEKNKPLEKSINRLKAEIESTRQSFTQNQLPSMVPQTAVNDPKRRSSRILDLNKDLGSKTERNKNENHTNMAPNSISGELYFRNIVKFFRNMDEMKKMLKEKDEMINELKKDINAIKKMYEVKLEVSNKEMLVLKDNLCAVKKMRETDMKTMESLRKTLSSVQIDADKLRKANKNLQIENDDFKKILSAPSTSTKSNNSLNTGIQNNHHHYR